MSKYITKTDLENALSPATVFELFGDANNGTLNETAIEAVIEDAEAEVESFLIGFVKLPLSATYDALIKRACKDFAMSFSFERHPEYVKCFGEEKRAERWKRAVDRMVRIRTAAQRLPDNEAEAGPPANVGGKVGAIGQCTRPDPPRRVFGNSGDW